MDKKIIYDNYNLWGDYEESARESLQEDGVLNPSDDEIWEMINIQDSFNWEDAKKELIAFFDDGSSWILRGQNERWNGVKAAGTIFTDFMDMFTTAMKDCDYCSFYEVRGHFYFQCTHHDGTNLYEIKKIKKEGLSYLERWEDDWDDKRSEQYVHDMIMKRYSTLPQYFKAYS